MGLGLPRIVQSMAHPFEGSGLPRTGMSGEVIQELGKFGFFAGLEFLGEVSLTSRRPKSLGRRELRESLGLYDVLQSSGEGKSNDDYLLGKPNEQIVSLQALRHSMVGGVRRTQLDFRVVPVNACIARFTEGRVVYGRPPWAFRPAGAALLTIVDSSEGPALVGRIYEDLELGRESVSPLLKERSLEVRHFSGGRSPFLKALVDDYGALMGRLPSEVTISSPQFALGGLGLRTKIVQVVCGARKVPISVQALEDQLTLYSTQFMASGLDPEGVGSGGWAVIPLNGHGFALNRDKDLTLRDVTSYRLDKRGAVVKNVEAELLVDSRTFSLLRELFFVGSPQQIRLLRASGFLVDDSSERLINDVDGKAEQGALSKVRSLQTISDTKHDFSIGQAAARNIFIGHIVTRMVFQDQLRVEFPDIYGRLNQAAEKMRLPSEYVDTAGCHPILAVAFLRFLSLGPKGPLFLEETDPDYDPGKIESAYAKLDGVVAQVLDEYVDVTSWDSFFGTFGKLPRIPVIRPAAIRKALRAGEIEVGDLVDCLSIPDHFDMIRSETSSQSDADGEED